MTDVQKELSDRIAVGWPELFAQKEALERVLRYYSLVLEENEVQNLTRLTSPKDFFEGHLLDVQALLKSGLVDYPAMDLGSGVGVPGLLSALIEPRRWILAESEGNKAKFLAKVAQELGLEGIQVFNGRGEKILTQYPAKSVVLRAVAQVDKIFAWLKDCSTWNNLILMKGPAWKEEWRGSSKQTQKHLRVVGEFEYAVGEEKKYRVIVKLDRISK